MAAKTTTHATASSLVEKYANEIAGKVIFTTGVSPNSLGAYYVISIAAAKPSLLIIAGRNPAKVQRTAEDIKAAHPDVPVRTLELDLSSFEAVRKAAAVVNGWEDVSHIDLLVNNAGIMAAPYSVSDDGIESQLATNHLGPFLFTNLIMDKILKSESPRIVNVASEGHRFHPFRFNDYNFDGGKTYNQWFAYGQAKTANMLSAMGWAQKLGSRGLVAVSLHPGVIATNLGSHLDAEASTSLFEVDKLMGNPEGWYTAEDYGALYLTIDQGAATHVYASFDKNLFEHNGVYLLQARLARPEDDMYRAWGRDAIDAERLWKLSEQLVGQRFAY